MQYEVDVNGRLRQVTVHRVDGRFVVSLDGEEWRIDAAQVDPQTLSLLIEDPGGMNTPAAETTDPAPAVGVASCEVTLTADAVSGRTSVTVGSVPVMVTLNGRRRWNRTEEGSTVAGGPQRLLAPMPGKIVRVLVTTGQAVKHRQPLIVVEAMKMENELRASADGVVVELLVQEGQSVDAGTLLAVLGPA